mmetsp:Transcript_12666/g.27346  ORF Transcript_12666/g.27346 Transcript_12666/m.27346 type:complete len:98 (-) Transcript_12666:785-1078(-)
MGGGIFLDGRVRAAARRPGEGATYCGGNDHGGVIFVSSLLVKVCARSNGHYFLGQLDRAKIMLRQNPVTDSNCKCQNCIFIPELCYLTLVLSMVKGR